VVLVGRAKLFQELGRWLLQKSKFDAVVLVDYSGYQGLDAVQWAVTELGSVVEQNLVDVAAANAVLHNQRILLILDNLEVYVAEKQETLQELLTVAQQWSLLGETRVLITTRPVELGHEAYQKDSENFRQLKLEGLDEKDALDYFERLLALSDNPVRLQTDELLRWFAKVQFHPLSIGLLARSLETEDLENLEGRLNQLMLELPDNPVAATLQLVIEQLDEESRRLLPMLGIFQGGAMEDVLLNITKLTEEQWQTLHSVLETTGLIQLEPLLNFHKIYIKFHPILASVLWTLLAIEEQVQLQASHRERYYELSDYLYDEDKKNPHKIRAIALQELPNLLFAVHNTLDVEETYAMVFVKNVNEFLDFFGLNRDNKALIQRIEHLDDFLARSHKGEQLFSTGEYQVAVQVFSEILKDLGNEPSFNHCTTLVNLGRCFADQGQAAQAAEYYRQGLAMAEQLESSQSVKRKKGVLQTDLADVLTDMGDYDGARKSYEKSLAIKDGDIRGEVVVLGQLGTLALLQGNLQEATQRYTEALAIFHSLNEPETEATIYHQLGRVYEKDERWDEAEQVYRKAACIRESVGNLAGMAQTWSQLAIVTQLTGKPEEAEAWFRKTLNLDKQLGNNKNIAFDLDNLANLLQTNYPNRLQEAQQLAEEALTLIRTLEPAAEIWKTYGLCAQIADKLNDTAKATKYHRKSLETYNNFLGTRYELQKHGALIAWVVAAVKNGEKSEKIEESSEENLVIAIYRILDGERDETVLCKPLNYRDGAIITAILEGIERPESLEWFEQDCTD
jgi:tetratricopeptide (TPR) repeat protein